MCVMVARAVLVLVLGIVVAGRGPPTAAAGSSRIIERAHLLVSDVYIPALLGGRYVFG